MERVGTWETSSRPNRYGGVGPRREAEEAKPSWKRRGVGRLHSTCEASNNADHKSVAEMVEGRRPAGGKASSNARPGLSAGYGVSPTLQACGSGVNGPPKPRTSIASNLRQEPGAGKPHAGICAGGGRGNSVPYRYKVNCDSGGDRTARLNFRLSPAWPVARSEMGRECA
jgi:hypothetical protein